MTRPENAEQTKRPQDPLTGADQPAHDESSGNNGSSGNGVAPRQRQRLATPGDKDPQPVPVGAPEPARVGAGREQPAPATVRIGGHMPPERVPPAASPLAGVPGAAGGSGAQSRAVRVPRRTNLQLKRLDPWSVLKVSLVLSVAGFLVWLVAVGILYSALAGMGVWDQINGTYFDLTSQGNAAQGTTELVSGGRVFGTAFVIGLVNIVLMTALATVGALVYNVAADFVGGIEVTLSEPD